MFTQEETLQIENFFSELCEKTDPSFKKIPTDTYNNFLKKGTLTHNQAEWIQSAKIKNRNLRSIVIPEIIQEEMEYALTGTSFKQEAKHEAAPVTNYNSIEEIIKREIEFATSRIINEINKLILSL